MNFNELTTEAFKLIRLEQAKTANTHNVDIVFYMEHGLMVDLKYSVDPKESLLAHGFVYGDVLLGFPVHPVLETTRGAKPPKITCINLLTASCIEA